MIFLLQVRQKQGEGSSWNKAMDEVRVERLIQKYKDSGELVSEDPALLMLKKWPMSKHYKDNPDRLPSLEQLVCQVFLYKWTCTVAIMIMLFWCILEIQTVYNVNVVCSLSLTMCTLCNCSNTRMFSLPHNVEKLIANFKSLVIPST